MYEMFFSEEMSEGLLTKYLLNPEKIPKEDGNSETINFTSSLLDEENWKIFFDSSFDRSTLKIHFDHIEEHTKTIKFGIACLLAFVRSNFTGPDLDKKTEEFLNAERFATFNFAKLLSINNEEINVNTKFPVLLVAAEIIFEFCCVCNIVNDWWLWRSTIIHQKILDELSPTLLSNADRLYKDIQKNLNFTGRIKASLDIEIAQLYLLFRNISKAKQHILAATEILGIKYDFVGILGKRTKYQEKDIAQLSLKVTVDEKTNNKHLEVDDADIPTNVPLKDDVRLNSIQFSIQTDKTVLGNTEQRLFLTIVQEIFIAKPKDELQSEEIQPFLDMILNQKNTYSIRTVALLLRCKLECKNRRTIERSIGQLEEVVNSLNRENPPFNYRVMDVFGTGLGPVWETEAHYGELLLNIGLVKTALEVYLKIKLWEEVIVCYTILKLRHKAAEVIKNQLQEKPTVKIWCLLGDATDDVSCYEIAWEMSKRRSHRAQRHWGQYFFLHKQYEECIPHFEKSVSINPLQANVWFRLGYAALQTENWQTAATAYRRYTTLEPEGFEAWNNLAQAYVKLGNKRNAHQAILEALKYNFENWKIWENLLVVSCDISNFSDVIRAYHSLIDLKDKYLNTEVLNVLVYNVCNNMNDCKGQPAQRFLQKTRELLGRMTALYPEVGAIWELYAGLAPVLLLRAQRLQRAFRGYTQGAWDKHPTTCQRVLNVCIKLAEIVLDNNINTKDTIVNSIRLNLSSAIAAVKKQDWEETKELIEQVSGYLEKITAKIKSQE